MSETLLQPGKTNEGVVALFNASDDTIDMIQHLLTEAALDQTSSGVISPT